MDRTAELRQASENYSSVLLNHADCTEKPSMIGGWIVTVLRASDTNSAFTAGSTN